MSDEIDIANDRAAADTARAEAAVRAAAAAIPVGEAGECIACGLMNNRLVYGMCSPCRDIRDRIGRINGTL